MLQLVQNIWLWALTGLAVPVIIHLWNVAPGKTLKVGSIALFTESARSHAKSLKLSDLLLLLLRCLLLAVLVLLLTQPFWEVDVTKEKGRVMIEKNSVKDAYSKFRPRIDSLLKAGYAFHYFNPGFEEVAFDAAYKKFIFQQLKAVHLTGHY